MNIEIARIHFSRDVSPPSSLLKVLMWLDAPNVHYQGEGEFMSASAKVVSTLYIMAYTGGTARKRYLIRGFRY